MTKTIDQTIRVAQLFNAMSHEYEDLQEEWYPHLFREIEGILRRELRIRLAKHAPLRALDVGCGTGLQSFVLSSMGYATVGVDIADDLLTVAREKARTAGAPITFQNASATELPFEANTFDAIACCGSVLSLIPDYEIALKEILRVLRPGGKAVIEAEHRWNLDLGWALVDSATGGFLGFGQSIKQSWRNVTEDKDAGIDIEYPFHLLDGSTELLPLHLFSQKELDRAVRRRGGRVTKRYGVHSVTNLLPSPLASRPHLPAPARVLVKSLCALDARVKRWSLFRKYANSYVIVVKKRASAGSG